MKKVLFAFVLLLVLSVLGVATFAMISNSEQEPVEDNSQAVEAPLKQLSFISYQREIPTYKLSEESLATLSMEFDKVIEENDEIEFENNFYIDRFMTAQSDACGVEYKSEYLEGKYSDFTVSTKDDADTVKYLMLLSYLTAEENNAVIWLGYDYDVMKSNLMPPRKLFVSYDYKERGYDNALEYHKAIKSGEAELGDNSYYVNFYSKNICKCTDEEKINLWDALKDK